MEIPDPEKQSDLNVPDPSSPVRVGSLDLSDEEVDLMQKEAEARHDAAVWSRVAPGLRKSAFYHATKRCPECSSDLGIDDIRVDGRSICAAEACKSPSCDWVAHSGGVAGYGVAETYPIRFSEEMGYEGYRPYFGDYEKTYYDVVLLQPFRGKREYLYCWPNAGVFTFLFDGSVSFPETQVRYIRRSVVSGPSDVSLREDARAHDDGRYE